MKRRFGKRIPKYPGGGDSNVFAFDDSTLKTGSDTLKYSVGKSPSSQKDAVTLETVEMDKQAMEKEMSKEEDGRMLESSFNQTIVTLDCDNDEEKQEMNKEMRKEEEAKIAESSFISTLESVDDEEKEETTNLTTDK